ncbi:putative polyketide synthase [Hypoxylon sp. FL0543]|nr:putative polyketide synthase [Hypoxylon sp. FL0543]
MAELSQHPATPIAVVGFSLKFPGDADSAEQFWKMLVEKRSAMSDFPSNRINLAGHYNPDPSRLDQLHVRGGNFLEEAIDRFDAPFFAINPEEAACMDPQQRGLLETAYRALENSGITIQQCSGTRTSVHIGSFTNDYRSVLFQDSLQGHRYAASGLSSSMLANRISWFFNLQGPSMNLDTACSSSLTCLHLACEDLRAGVTEMGLVGGCNLFYHPDYMKMMSNMGVLSADSRSWSLDERANGYSRGEGFGILVIKRLSDAIRDGDTIRAVIRATGLNQDGRTPGITVPSGAAQKELIRETYSKANLDMEPTRFFEAHATGTQVGDPVEANAVGEAFSHVRSRSDPLWVGTVKSNLGHLEAASGMAGILKSILVLEKGVIPPNAGFEKLNSRIEAERYHLAIPTEAIPWPRAGLRRLCVNSFGFGGSNAIVILDDAGHYLLASSLVAHHRTQVDLPDDQLEEHVADQETERNENPGQHSGLLVWSSVDEDGVRRMQSKLASFFKQHQQDLEGNDMRDIEYTLGVRRTLFPWRSFVAFSNLSDLCEKLATPLPKAKASQSRNVAFVFSGQGAQYEKMGMSLLRFPAFRESLARSQVLLSSMGCEWQLLDALYAAPDANQINRPEYSQPLCTALQLALVDLLEEFGIKPEAVVGHSSGEIAAAYCVGALCQRSALQVAFHRGRLAATLATSADRNMGMTAAGVSRDEAMSYLEKLDRRYNTIDVDIACVNSASSVTFSGDEAQLSFLERLLKDDHKFVRTLHVSIAYHSRFVEPLAESYRMSLNDLCGSSKKSNPTPVFISSVTGDFIDLCQLCMADYWVKNMTSPVEFFDAISKMTSLSGRRNKVIGMKNGNSLGISDLIEIGPHNTLQGPIRESLQTLGRQEMVQYYAALSRASSTAEQLLSTTGKLFSHGYPVNVLAVNNLPASSRSIRTDLPEYDFQHSHSYWRESRIGRNYRLRDTPHHDLLGVRSSDWNPLQAQWRNLVSEAQLPWLRDHKIAADFLYPAGGMISMAVEAAKQLADPAKNVIGYELRKLQLLNAFRVLHREGPVETRFSLFPHWQTLKWSHFQLFAHKENSWVEICRGQVRIHYDGEHDEKSRLQRWDVPGLLEQLPKTRRALTSEQHYSRLSSMYAAEYGPAFQTLGNIFLSEAGEFVADLDTRKWASAYGDKHVSPHVVHPATIDGIFQLVFAASDPVGNTKKILVPSRVGRIWINARGLAALDDRTVRVVGECSSTGYRRMNVRARVVSKNSTEPLIDVEHHETIVLSRDDIATADPNSTARKLCARMRWLPDLDLLSPNQIQRATSLPRTVQNEITQFYLDLHLAIRYFLFDTLKLLKDSNIPGGLKSHRQNLVCWAQYQMSRETYGSCGVEQQMIHDAEFRNARINHLRGFNAEGRALMTLGEKLYEIILEEVDPLQILFDGTLASDYYREVMTCNPQIATLARYLDLLGHKQPDMRILEIGAGTGSTTQSIISALSEGRPRWSQYYFTDISPAFFADAKNKFSQFSSSMNFLVFDAGRDPLEQGFEHSSLDLIVAGNVLHALKDLKTSLKNIRSLLKPGSKLILFESTSPSTVRVGLYGGVFKDWWNSIKDPKAFTPLLSIDSWRGALEEAGFAGLDLILKDYEDDSICEQSILVASTSTSSPAGSSRIGDVTILFDHESKEQEDLTRPLAETLNANGATCRLLEIESLGPADLSGGTCVSLLEVGRPLLSRMQRETFDKIKHIVGSFQDILWVTQDDKIPVSPEFAVVDGFARVIRVEYPLKNFVTLALEPRGNRLAEENSQTVTTVLRQMLSTSDYETEFEYREHEGLLNINRVIHSKPMNEMISARSKPQYTKRASLKSSPPLELRVGFPGLLDTVQYHEIDVALDALAEDDILVRVRAFGLTLRDYQIASGQIDGTGFGIQCSGIVEMSGPTAEFSVGDRVCVVKHSAFQTLLRCNTADAVKIPESISFTDASSIPAAAMLAVHCLIHLARIEGKETVLIHEAATTAGQIFLQVAQNLQARVFATVRDEEQRKQLCSAYDIPEKDIFIGKVFSKNTLLEATNDQGVDVVINSSADEWIVENSWGALSCLGRLIHIGEHEIAVPESRHDHRNVSFSCVEVGDILSSRPKHARRLLEKVSLLIRQKALRPPVGIQVYGPEDTTGALQYFRGEGETGNSVIDLGSDSEFMMTMKTRPAFHFDSGSTYVIAGGLGGLGRSIARWMVDRGARHLLLLSRRGLANPRAGTLLEELAGHGVQVLAPSCDIADVTQLQGVVDQALQTMPRIRGCIQAAMLLRDAPFEKMTWQDWVDSTRPKVQGSWNLHETMPRGMDFFVLLSSASAIIGSVCQSNYAAGNSYEDALCHYRNVIGEHTSVVNLGMLVSEGVVAETEGLLSSLRSIGQLMEISQAELFAILEHHCNPENHSQESEDNQTIFGIELPLTIRNKRQELPNYLLRPLFRHFHYIDSGSANGASTQADQMDYASAISNAASTHGIATEMVKWLRDKLSGLLGVAGDDIDTLKPLSMYGVDSLVGVELRNWFEKELGVKISIFELLGTSNVADICQLAATRTKFREEK